MAFSRLHQLALLVFCMAALKQSEQQYNSGQYSVGGIKIPKDGDFSKVKVPAGFTIPKSVGGVQVPKELQGKNAAQMEEMTYIDPKWVENFKIGGMRKYEKNGEESCLHFGKRLLIRALPAFNECMKDMRLTFGALRKNVRDTLPCMVKCMGIKLEILNPDGTFNFDYAKNLLSEQVPPRFLEFIWKIWDDCKSSAMSIKSDDGDCKSYRSIIHCAVNSAFKVASEAMKLCPDIPDVFKKAAKGFISSKNQRSELDRTIAVSERRR